MKLTLNDRVALYKKYITEDIDATLILLHDAQIARESYFDSLSQLQNKFHLFPSSALYVYDGTENQFAYRYKFNSNLRKLFPVYRPEIKIFRMHAVKYIEAFIDEQKHLARLNYLKRFQAKFTYNVFNKLMDALGNKLTYLIIKGYLVKFGRGMGTMEIIEKTLIETDAVNWDKSIKLRDALTKENIKLYNHKTGEGEKWLVRHEPVNCWFHWHRNTLHKDLINQIILFTFIPTDYINSGTRVKDDYLSNNPTEEQILTDEKLGSVNKLQYLLTLDPTVAFRYRKYDQRLTQ